MNNNNLDQEIINTFQKSNKEIKKLQTALQKNLDENPNFYKNETPIEINLSDDFSFIVPTKRIKAFNPKYYTDYEAQNPIWYLKYKNDDLKTLNLGDITNSFDEGYKPYQKDLVKQSKNITAYNKKNIVTRIQRFQQLALERKNLSGYVMHQIHDSDIPLSVQNKFEQSNSNPEDIKTLKEAFSKIGNSKTGINKDILKSINTQVKVVKDLEPKEPKRFIFTTDEPDSYLNSIESRHLKVKHDEFLNVIAKNSSPNNVATTAREQVKKDFDRFLMNRYTEELINESTKEYEEFYTPEEKFNKRNENAINTVIIEANEKGVTDFIHQELREKPEAQKPYKNMAIEINKAYNRAKPSDKKDFEKEVLKAAQKSSYIKRPGEDYLIDKNQKPFTSNNIGDLKNTDGTLKNTYQITGNHDGLLTIEPIRKDTKDAYTISLDDVKNTKLYQKVENTPSKNPSIVDELKSLQRTGFDLFQKDFPLIKAVEQDISNDLKTKETTKSKDLEPDF